MFERLSSEPIYNTRAVVRRTAIPADTFRAWERRYGIPSPSRTSGQHRLYSERDIATIGWLRDQTNSGMMISQAIALLQSQNAARMRDHTHVRTESATPIALDASRGEAAPFQELREELAQTLMRFDGNAADRIVEESLALANLENVCLHVLHGALVEIGNQLKLGAANVAVEHFASCYVHRKLGAIFNLANPHEGRGPIVAVCPDGEMHEIGLLLTCLFLSRRGYQILYLGASLPLDDLVFAVDRVQPPLVIFSASREETARLIARAVAPLKSTVRDHSGRDLPEIGYGGQVFAQRPDLRQAIDGTYLGIDARDAVTNVDRIFGLLSA
jgi:DNA-binding transcriptional MerR regulator